MDATDDSIYTRNLFIVFLVSLLILVLSALFEYFFFVRKALDGPIYKQRQTVRFGIKKWVAKFLIKFKKHDKTPDHLVDKLRTFSDKDEMVRVFRIQYSFQEIEFVSNNYFVARRCSVLQYKFRKWANSIVFNCKTTKWSCQYNWYSKNSWIQ